MGIFLISRWAYGFLIILLGYLTMLLFGYYGFLPVVLFLVGFPIFTIGYFALIERMSLRCKQMRPKICSIYDKYYWEIEHHWKICGDFLMLLFKGTPLKNVISRLLGVKVGKLVFDDGSGFSEKTLLEIGDYCTLNEACIMQSHSLEDGVFKSDYIKIGDGSTIGCNAFIHYGVKIGDNIILDPHSFLMKGETPNSNCRWQGNPAKRI